MPVPRAGSAVEVYSQTAGTWLPATVLAVDGGDLHVRYILLDSSAREKWATASEWREPVIADSRKVASSRRALPPPRRGTAAAYVASDRPGTAPAATQPTRAPKRPAAISPATEPLKVGDSHMQVFSASAGRWVDALVVEVDRAGGGYRVSYVVAGDQRQKWVDAADVRRFNPVAAGQDTQTQGQVALAHRLPAPQLAVGEPCEVFSASAATWVRATLLEIDNGEAVRRISTLYSLSKFYPTRVRLTQRSVVSSMCGTGSAVLHERNGSLSTCQKSDQLTSEVI
jgi:hypothetical protein